MHIIVLRGCGVLRYIKLHASVFAPQRRVGHRRANREERRRRRASAFFLLHRSVVRADLVQSTIRLLESPKVQRARSGPHAPVPRAEARRLPNPTNRRAFLETVERPADDALLLRYDLIASVPKRDAPVRPIRHVKFTFRLCTSRIARLTLRRPRGSAASAVPLAVVITTDVFALSRNILRQN